MNHFEPPSLFQEDNGVYARFLSETVNHSQGFFILAPSGTGKTHFISRQKEKHWIDGDTLWVATGAHPATDWWTKGLDVIDEVDARSDTVTVQAKRLGLWIMGASNNWLAPDAIVLLPWKKNVAYIKHREENNYDGGLTTKQLAQLKAHRADMKKLARNKKVPIFASVEEAVQFIEKKYQEEIGKVA